DVAGASAPTSPEACRLATSVDANDSPSFLSALGGSSSQTSSTRRFLVSCALMSGSLLLLVDLGDHFVGPRLGRHREAEARAALEIALRHGARQVADAADVGGAFGDAD